MADIGQLTLLDILNTKKGRKKESLAYFLNFTCFIECVIKTGSCCCSAFKCKPTLQFHVACSSYSFKSLLFTYFILLKAEANWLKGSVGLLRAALHRVPVLMVVVEASQGAAAVAGLRRAVVVDDVTSRLSGAGFLILH